MLELHYFILEVGQILCLNIFVEFEVIFNGSMLFMLFFGDNSSLVSVQLRLNNSPLTKHAVIQKRKCGLLSNWSNEHANASKASTDYMS